MHIEIMDTTLRDGEQTSGVAFTPSEKLTIARMLIEEVGVDRLEVASARISKGEYEGVQRIMQWAQDHGHIDRIEVLGFVDGGKSVDWIEDSGARVMNLLTKGSKKHLDGQLRQTLAEHVANIKAVVQQATQKGIKVNVYLEDWSNGMRHSPEHVFAMLEALQHESIERFMLPDTLGILNPTEMRTYFGQIVERFPDLHFDCHTHNDYDLAVANVHAAVEEGARGVHTTVNGLGERTGNAPLASVVAVINDQIADKTCGVAEAKLNRISKLVEAFAAFRTPVNKPIVGENVFTQTCGVHADGDNKGDLYVSELTPERFGRTRQYALGKTSGKASVLKNLQELGIDLSVADMQKVTKRIVELGDKKKSITQEDLPYIISDVLGTNTISDRIKIHNYFIAHVHNMKPTATLSLDIDGEIFEKTATGEGQYDAFMKALRKIYKQIDRKVPNLIDYVVTIPPGGRTDALVETIITWQEQVTLREFKTRGLEVDQTAAAITATLRMLNLLSGMQQRKAIRRKLA